MIVWLALALVGSAALFSAWLWMATEREEGYGYRLVSYPEAYLPEARPTLNAIELRGDEMTIELTSERTERHRVRVPDGRAEHALRVEGFGGTPQRFQTFRGGFGPPVFASSSLVRASGDRATLKEHVADVEDYPREHVEQVRKLLARAPLKRSGRTLERFRSLWTHLYAELAPHAGPPPPDFQTIPAFVQYERAMRGEMKLFCANYAEILTLFATVAGFHVRIVDATGEINDIPVSAHTFVELYVPELERFVYTDLTLKLFQVRLGANGPPLDSAQIVQVEQMGGRESLFVEVMREGGLRLLPEREGPQELSLFINPNAVFVFHQQYRGRFAAIQRALRYVLANEPAYALNRSGFRFRLRSRVQAALIVLGIVTLALGARVMWRRRRAA